MLIRRISVVAATLAVSLAVAACGSSSSSGSTSSKSEESNAAPSAASGGSSESASSGSGNGKTVGIVDLVESDPLNQQVIKGVETAAKEKGWNVKVFNANANADAANSEFKTYASEKVNMILDLAFPVSSVGSGLQAAREAKIPVGGWGSGLAPGILMTTVDDVGKPSVESVVEAMGGKSGKGSVLALFFTGGQVCRERQAVFTKVLKEAPGVKVQVQELSIPGETTQGQQFTTAWLATHPANSENLAVWGCWDSPMYGAVAALRQQNRTDVKTFSINGSPQAIQDVKEGVLTNEVWENGYQEGVEVFKTTLEGIEAGSSWKPKIVKVPGMVVTKSNVDEFLAAKHP